VGSGIGFADISFPAVSPAITFGDLSLPGFTGSSGQSWSIATGTQNFSATNLLVPVGQTGVAYFTATLVGSPINISGSTTGLTFDVCGSAAQLPASGTYTFSYVQNGTPLGAVLSTTVASGDATCPSNTHVAGPVTPIGALVFHSGDTLGITLSH
jgi:hypothetical protein